MSRSSKTVGVGRVVFWGSKLNDFKQKCFNKIWKPPKRKGFLIISMNTTPLAADVVCVQGNGKVNMYPFPPPSGIPRKQSFISVDPWLVFIIQNAQWRHKRQSHWLSILENWAFMRNLSNTESFLLMLKSDNGLSLPEILWTWDALWWVDLFF